MRRNGLFLIVLALAAVALILPRFRGTAATPGVFDDGWTLAAAQAMSADQDKPVLAFLTADWCGPCQAFKRGALSNPAVESFVRANMIPVYLDIDKSPDDAQRFADVSSVPTTIVWYDGREIDRAVGGMGTGAFRAWLEDAAARSLADTP